MVLYYISYVQCARAFIFSSAHRIVTRMLEPPAVYIVQYGFSDCREFSRNHNTGTKKSQRCLVFILGQHRFWTDPLLTSPAVSLCTVLLLDSQGGMIVIGIIWDCDLDWSASHCNPTFNIHGLYGEDSLSTPGYNFRYETAGVCDSTWISVCFSASQSWPEHTLSAF